MNRSKLPVDALLPAITASVRSHPITLLQAEPGAGKTTRVPPALVAAGFQHVIVLEPRRIAARMAARRVAEELGESVGATVGYQVRFEEQGSAGTKLWFVTEGVLVQRLARDPYLRQAEIVMLDEFHERHLETDLALALLRRAQAHRPDLRLVLMSATLDAESLQARLGSMPVLSSPGRQHPVTIRHTPYSATPLDAQVAAALQSVMGESKGHVLVFLPGAAEIRRAMEASAGIVRAANAKALALHGDLSAEEQDRVVAPAREQKVIFSTNVAESSITIEGVRTVIDSGLARVASWSVWSGLGQLRVEKISQSSAIQRAGRAGRLGPGQAIRLYAEEDFRRRPAQSAPEIARADLSQTVLQLAAMQLTAEDLQWLEPPPAAALAQARELLVRLGAMDTGNRITATGRHMSRLPVHPRLARLAQAGAEYGAAKEAAFVAAALSEGRVRLQESDVKNMVSDLDVILASDVSGTVRRLQQQIVRNLPRKDARADSQAALNETGLEKAALLAYPDRVVRKRGEVLLLSSGGSARLDRASAVHSEFACALDVDERSEQASPLVRIACPIEADWLLELFSQRIQTRETLEWNRTAERVDQVSAILYDALVIDESAGAPQDAETATEMLVKKALEAGIQRFADKDSLDRLLQRIRFTAQYSDEVPAPDDLVERALRQLARGLRAFSELKQALGNGGLESSIESLLPHQMVDELAPTHIRLPSGRRARIEYPEDQSPFVASRLQDFFGMRETPRVANGALPVVVHLLAPNQRPVQMTQDLASFWKTLYPQVRRELSRRYPRHKWPEDPYSVERDG